MMNRQGAVPQTLRGMPAGFGGQQQPQQPGRSVSNRLPNGSKLGSNGSGWAAFGGAVPMSSAGLQNQPRQLGGNMSFAQSLSGSQPATPLDLAEFPSLSNTSQLASGGQSSLWSTTGASRNVGGPLQRNQSTPLSSQPQLPQDDLFSPATTARLPSGQSSFRFGNQTSLGSGQPSQVQPGSIDDFPPLNRNVGGEIGQERASSLMSALGFSSQNPASSSGLQSSRTQNGLLSALSANNRTSETRTPPGASAAGASRPQDVRGAVQEEEARQKPATFRDDVLGMASAAESSSQVPETRRSLGAIGNEAPASLSKEDRESRVSSVKDPLEGMPEIDKWGIKGLRTLMHNYPDYNAMIMGMDPQHLGIDMTSTEMISTQHYSLFDDVPPRPAIPKFHLPECYHVTNVQPIETKIPSFNEETLFWIFYSCPQDIKQQLAAVELHSRNWRWHKKLRIWLTKDEHVMPQLIGPNHERGCYVVWDTDNWRKDRREFTLYYADLDTSLAQQSQ